MHTTFLRKPRHTELKSLSKPCWLMGKRPVLLCPMLRFQVGVCRLLSVPPGAYQEGWQTITSCPGALGLKELPFPHHSTLCFSDLSQGRAAALCTQWQLCCWENLAGPQRTFVRARTWVHNAILPPCHTLSGFHGWARSTPLLPQHYLLLPTASPAGQRRQRGASRCFLGHEFLQTPTWLAAQMTDLRVSELCPQLLCRTFTTWMLQNHQLSDFQVHSCSRGQKLRR